MAVTVFFNRQNDSNVSFASHRVMCESLLAFRELHLRTKRYFHAHFLGSIPISMAVPRYVYRSF